MSDPHLLVPINIEALVVGKSTTTKWVNLKPDFTKISGKQVLGRQIEKPAFTEPESGLHKPGVHLHWALPDGLTHGTAKEGSDVPDFPLIPNRWLVLRFWDQSESDKPNLISRAWIIESDTITNDTNANLLPILHSEKLKQPPQKPEDYAVFVGNVYELKNWPGESNEPQVEITAIGYGDPAFAAYYPACKGILGFHDHYIDDIRENTELTYMVVGWYSKPSLDPLWKALHPPEDPMKKSDDQFTSLAGFLEKARWTYPDFQSLQEKQEKAKDSNTDITGLANQIPTAILCHGLLEGAKWNRHARNGVPLGRAFDIAIADTAVDALTALLAKESGKESNDDPLAKLLSIFQYDLIAELEKPGGDSLVEAKIHERSFRPLARGIRWDLLQDDYSVTDSTSERSSPPIPGDIRLLLEKLNALQREINCKKRDREFLQSEIYAAWYKKVLNVGQQHITEELSTKITRLRVEVCEHTNKIDMLENTSATRQNEIEKNLETFLPGWKLKQFDEPEFRQPNDPVVLLNGDAFRWSSRHGEDDRFRKDGRLLCRLSGKEITCIKVKIPETEQEVAFTPNDIDAKQETDDDDYWRKPFDVIKGVPADFHQEIVNLLGEALLLTLDSKRAQHIITRVYKTIDPDNDHSDEAGKWAGYLLNDYLKRLWENASNPESEIHLAGTCTDEDTKEVLKLELVGQFPSPVTKNTWAGNPWLPLFLQWQVGWVPDSTDTQNALQKWELNPKLNDHVFVWKGREPEDDKGKVTYTGTSILTPGVGLHLSERLHQYNLLHENQPLRTLQTAINSKNVLCQSLGGFTDQLLMRRNHLELRPFDLEQGKDDSQFSSIYETVKDIDWLSPMTEGTFLPLRAGRLKLEKLWIIDTFGQFLQLEGQDPVYGLKTISPQSLTAADNTVRLQPRLAQPARLSMQWIPAEDKVYKDEDFNPVCGWILPNFLDKSLMIYDAGGYALGALQVVQKKSWSKGAGGVHEELESFHWIDIPGSRDIFFGTSPKEIKNPIPEEANPHLRDFVMGLLPLSEGCGQRFSDLLNSMSEVLAYSSAGDAVRNQNLALLIGKPFALVQASLSLEVDGRPATSPEGLTGGIENLRFPLHLGNPRKGKDLWLGDDGLAGFFLDNKYDKFHPVFRLTENGDSYSIYDDSGLQISISTPLKLTLLMDPARGISVTSGILPRTVFPFPYHDLVETMENKQVVFFSGPVLNPVSNEGIRMPRPSDIYGQWSWTHHPEVMTWGEAAIGDVEQEQNVFPDPPPRIVEGWLKLVTAPLEVRAFTVTGKNPVDKTGEKAEPSTPPCFQVSADKNTITLSWSVIGAEKIELWMKKKEENIRLFQSQSHPLPAQYTIKADGDTLFTLFAFGRKEVSADEKEPKQKAKSIRITMKKAGDKP
ncbi:MAG: hypothetical protein ABFD75_07750 [Smithella sp.]